MSDRIPREVLSDILTNPELSIEDVVRCTVVCKSWYSLITSPPFVSLHTQRIASIANNCSLFLVRKFEPKPYCNTEDESFSIHSDNDSFPEYKSLDFSSSQSQCQDFEIINCLRGVVCFSHKLNSHIDDIVLWNPTIRKYLRLPQPLEPFDSVEAPIRSIGFGFDAATNGFKVVRVLHYWRRKAGARYHAEVYELNLGCWRSINPVGLCGGHEFGNQAFLKGVVHWAATDWDVKRDKMIVSFDFQDEVFGVMNVPDCLNFRWNLHVSVIGESLSLAYNECSGPRVNFCIWVMKQYGRADSWTKQFNIDHGFDILPWKIFGFLSNGEALLADRTERALSCYDANKKRFGHLKQFPHVKFDVVNFMESLALLEAKGKHVMQTETEDRVISKGSPDVHVEKKSKIQSH